MSSRIESFARYLLTTACLAGALSPVAFSNIARAQVKDREPAMTDGEVDKLRDTAYYPPERVLAFVAFLDQRTREVDKLGTGKRRPGREEDLHDLLEQFTSIADDLQDNLDDYGKSHRDIRKVLPRLVAATERWSTSLRTPPDHEAYNVARKLALETLADIHESATRMIEEQKAWFLAHPPAREDSSRPPPPPR